MDSSKPLKNSLPPIPAKRYFTIGEVSELCAVKAHVLRYWQHEGLVSTIDIRPQYLVSWLLVIGVTPST